MPSRLAPLSPVACCPWLLHAGGANHSVEAFLIVITPRLQRKGRAMAKTTRGLLGALSVLCVASTMASACNDVDHVCLGTAKLVRPGMQQLVDLRLHFNKSSGRLDGSLCTYLSHITTATLNDSMTENAVDL